jgi:hypothetical protein
VLPEAPRLAPMFDIGAALGEVADGIDGYKMNKRRQAEQQKADDRYADSENQRRIDRALDRQRTERIDLENAKDRKLSREQSYQTTKSRAADDGYVSDAQRGERQGMARTVRDGSAGLGGAMGMAGGAIGDALYAASTGGDTMTLTRPDESAETLYYDPTQTKEARDENTWMRRQNYAERNKPAPRDVVGDELREYEGKLKIDQRYKTGDFKPERAPRGGGGGGSVNDPRIGIADKQFDNADRVVARIEKEEPKAPNYDTWRGTARPMEGEDDYPAFKSDSTATAGAYNQQHRKWQAKLGDATRKAQEWFSIGDALAKQATGASGGDAILTGQQVNAQREIQQASAEFQRAMAQVGPDKIAQRELQQRFTADVNLINQKYGIRPKPEE